MGATQAATTAQLIGDDEDVRAMRLAAGRTQMDAAVQAGVSIVLVRLYEARPSAVTDPRKRRNLDAVYAVYSQALNDGH